MIRSDMRSIVRIIGFVLALPPVVAGILPLIFKWVAIELKMDDDESWRDV